MAGKRLPNQWAEECGARGLDGFIMTGVTHDGYWQSHC
jgi:hypothetical protein